MHYPYFVPDEATLLAILTAASSGFEVELFVSEMRQIESAYRNNSRSLDAKAWRARPLHEKVLDGLARLTSALQ